MNRKKTILIILAAAIVLVFVGVSAVRYFTVVQPQQQASQQEAEQTSQENTTQSQDGTSSEPADSQKDSAKNESHSPRYSGESANVFSLLVNSTWVDPVSGQTAVFREEGTYGSAVRVDDAGADTFEILSVKGSLSDDAGCTAIVKLGNSYDMLTILTNNETTVSAFENSPESSVRIKCDTLGDHAFFRDPSQIVSVVGLDKGPNELVAHADDISQLLTSYCVAQLPVVSEATWNGIATYYYNDTTNPKLLVAFNCNDPQHSTVNVVYDVNTNECYVVANSNDLTNDSAEPIFSESSEVQTTEPGVAYVPSDTGQMNIPPSSEAAQKSWNEAAQQAAEREAAQASDEGGNQ